MMTPTLQIQTHNGLSTWDGQFHERTCGRAHHLKIPGAFYTSTERPDGTSAWTAWARTEMPRLVRDTMFRFQVAGRPNLLVLRTDADLLRAFKGLGLLSGPAIVDEPSVLLLDADFRRDFRARVTEHYDGIHIPADFDRFSSSGLAYDCETTAWFRPGEHLSLLGKTEYSA